MSNPQSRITVMPVMLNVTVPNSSGLLKIQNNEGRVDLPLRTDSVGPRGIAGLPCR